MTSRRKTTKRTTTAPRTATRKQRAGEAELLAQIYATPEDDGPRIVYADFLQSHSDPRGEFVALQIERARDKARSGGRQRENELLAKHRKAWERPLEARSSPGSTRSDREVVFERGFPERVASWKMGLHPAWSTVTSCTAAPHDDAVHAGALKSITAARDADIAALAKLTKPLAVEELAWEHAADRRSYDELSPALIRQLSSIRVLPKLRKLVLGPWAVGTTPTPESLAFAWTAPAFANLETLGVPGHDIRGWIAALSATRLARFELSWISFQRCMTIACVREQGAFSSLHVTIERSTRDALTTLAREVGRLAPGTIATARVAIHLQAEWDKSGTQRGVLARAFAKAGIDATVVKAVK